MSLIEREAKLFEAGEYKDRQLTVSTADLDALVAGFAEVPVKIEHSSTPFDGALGMLKSISRKGNDLMGKIGFTKEAWALIDKAGARKLSVGIKKDKSALTEVSLVKSPRVASAVVFDDHVEFEGVVEFGFGGLSASDIESQVGTLLEPQKVVGLDGSIARSGPWPYITATYEDNCVVSMGRANYKYPFTVKDGTVILGEPTEVVQSWKAKATSTTLMTDSPNKPGGDSKVAEIDEVKTFTKEEVEAQIAAAEAKFSTEMKKRDDEIAALAADKRRRDAQAVIDGHKQSGKLAPAAEEFAMAILASDKGDVIEFGTDKLSITALFSKLMDAQPAVVSFKETGKAGDKQDEVTFSEAEIEATMKLRRFTREQALESLKKLK